MKKTLLTLITGISSLICGYILGGYLVYASEAQFPVESESRVLSVGDAGEKHAETGTSAFETGTSAFKEFAQPIFTLPVRLEIDQYGINIELTPLGVNSAGQLEVPTNPSEGGWYYKSAKPGEEGNVLINAHYDDAYGRPAAFFNLKSVKVNDTVVLVDSYDRQFPYRVTEVYYISIYDENRVERLLESQGHSLTLVTCGGFWVPNMGTYNQRLVVKAQLEK